MHELSVCQGLMGQLERVAGDNGARVITRVLLRIGPLSGIEPELLLNAWTIASAGSIAEQADMVIEDEPIRVRCSLCGAETEATANKLVCGECGDWRTTLISGDGMQLASVELERD